MAGASHHWLVMALPAFSDNIEHELGRVRARDRVRSVAIAANRGIFVSLRQLFAVNRCLICFG
jgi:hypothetical protein